MDAPMDETLLKYSLLSRSLVFILQVVFNILIPDHNADVFNPPYDQSKDNPLDTFVHYILGGFIRWDGVYFLHVAEHGYIYENSLAFFPLFPWCVRILANSLFWPMQFVMQYRTVLIVSGFIFNLVIFLKATIVLYRLSESILKSESLAYKATLLFCFNPASIFISAFYSEILFAYLTFSSMLKFEERKGNQSLMFSSLSCLSRSNGLLTAGFELHRRCQNIVIHLLYSKIDFINKILLVLTEILKVVIYLILFLLPFLMYQFYISDLFCNQSGKWKIPEFLIQYGRQRSYNLVNKTDFDWCNYRIPFAYSHVQNTHWNVGFLRYYEFRQIPNFILALPVSVLSVSSVIYYYRQNPKICLTLGLIPEKNIEDSEKNGFINKRMLPYIAHLLFITVFGWFFIHIQVLTRMVFSSSPIVYWYAAIIISTDHHAQNMKASSKKHSKYFKICDISDISIFDFRNGNTQSKMIVLYFLGYFLIGIFMFSNFLPWT
ncbi:GPI mannosyltransferase 2-like [Mytilus californianus]|uniref:GPI mannosyltransferase 2-like n=1 Tax=Mytilus californianus TaxID=6549 RepID=UPI002245B805|nr:GPI mannosyltransferase 2-like [Mytilus californianus]